MGNIFFNYNQKMPEIKSGIALIIDTIRGLPTFAGKTHYHRPWELSLLCSAWEQVEHSQYNPLILSTIFRKEEPRRESRWDKRFISTPRLHPLPSFHLGPINLVISQEPKRPNLGVGFPLRCLQRLSLPSIATQRCRWRDSWYTRGWFGEVLSSSFSYISVGLDYTFTPFSRFALANPKF